MGCGGPLVLRSPIASNRRYPACRIPLSAVCISLTALRGAGCGVRTAELRHCPPNQLESRRSEVIQFIQLLWAEPRWFQLGNGLAFPDGAQCNVKKAFLIPL